MKTFAEYLTEARMAPLYHGTSIGFAQAILHHNEIRGLTSQNFGTKATKFNPETEDIRYGVSLTRSYDFAAFHPARKEDGQPVVVIELDQQKLIHNYKIVPFNYWDMRTRYLNSRTAGHRRNEYEEFLLGVEGIKNISRYITKIIARDKPVLNKIQSDPKWALLRDHPLLYCKGKFVNLH